MASFSGNKNQLFSLKVLNELLKLHSNTRLNLVGASNKDTYYQKLIDYVKTNNVENYVSLIDRSDNVQEIYKKTTFCIIPSLREGFSLVAIEAQACGISVFGSSNITSEVDCDGIRYLDLAKGPTYWADEIYKLFLTKGNKRTKYDVSKFSFDRFKKEVEDIYQKG